MIIENDLCIFQWYQMEPQIINQKVMRRREDNGIDKNEEVCSLKR